jgi:glucose uptake protein GlcU
VNRDDWIRIRRILTVGGVAFCVETAVTWHDWRALLVNAVGVIVAAVVIRHKRRRGRRSVGAR